MTGRVSPRANEVNLMARYNVFEVPCLVYQNIKPYASKVYVTRHDTQC